MGDYMDVQIMKLDDSFTAAEDLHKTIVGSADAIMRSLETVINNLSTHWISSDATIHINHLIEGYNRFGMLFESLFQVSNNTVGFLVDMQTIRSKTGGKTDVGEKVTDMYTHKVINSIPNTSQYHYDDAVVTDYNNLVQIDSFFDGFIHKVKDTSDELLLNWKKGHGREETEHNYEEFTRLAAELKKYMADTITELKTMKGNVETNISEK